MPEGLNGAVDQQARRDVAEVRHELRNYMAVNDIKASNLQKEVIDRQADVVSRLDEVKSLLKWACSLIVTLIIGVLGWSLLQQIQNNSQQQKELQTQIKLLEQQEQARRLQLPDQRVLPPSAAESALATQRAGQ